MSGAGCVLEGCEAGFCPALDCACNAGIARAIAITNAASRQITLFPEVLVPLCPPIASLTRKKKLPPDCGMPIRPHLVHLILQG